MAQLQSTVVTGNTSTTGFMSAGSRRLSMGILDLNSGGTPTQFKIKTTIPWNSGGADFTVNIKGFRYSGAQMVSLSVGWHHYNNTFFNEGAISNGSWAPPLTLAKSPDNFVIIHIASPGYWPKLYVESLYSSTYLDGYSSGWTWSDADLSDCTDVSLVSYSLLATSISGNAVTTSQTNFATLTLNSAAVATQTWVQSQGYLTSVSDVWVNTTGDTMTGTLTIARGQDANVTNLNINSGVTPVSAFQINSDQPNLRSILMARNGYSLVLGTQDTNRVTINTSGNVGIGTTTPGAKLEVYNGDIWLNAASAGVNPEILFIDDSGISTAGAKIRYGNADGNLYIEHIWNTDSSGIFFRNRTGGTALNTLSLVNGRVGIGITTPQSLLDVRNGNLALYSNSYGNTGLIRMFGTDGVEKYQQGLTTGGDFYQYTFAGLNHIFYTNNGNERMRITSGGNVGIGTATPISKLQIGSSWTPNPGAVNTIYLGVSGFAGSNLAPEVIITSNIASTAPGGAIGLALHNSNTTAGAFAPLLVFSKTETGATPYNAAIAAIGARTVTGTGASDSYIDGDLIFYTSPTAGSGLVERLRIIQNGNVGIGITNPTYKFEVSDGTRTGVFNPNSTLDGFFIGTKEAKPLILGSSDTERLRITSTGNVGVGTISPTVKFQIDTTGFSLRLRETSDGTSLVISGNQIQARTSADAGSPLYLNYTNGGNIYIGTGLVGIGTITPSSIIDASVSTGATSGFRFKGYSDASTPYLLSLGTHTYQDIFQIKSVNGLVTMGIVGAIGSTPDLVIQTNTTERIRITSLGNIYTAVGSAISYGSGETYQIWNSEPQYAIVHNDANWKDMKTFIPSKSGNLKFKFSAYISSGTYYFAWRIRQNGTTTVASGHYNLGLDTGEVSSVHAYRRFVASVGPIAAGDSLVLQMISSGGDGTPATGNGQTLYVKEFRAYSTVPNVEHGGASNIWGDYVGIGTTTPTYKLHIVSPNNENGLFVSAANASPFNAKIATFRYAGNGNDINIEAQGGKAAIQARAGASTMDLLLNAAGGYVGIGTTSPATPLHVLGGPAGTGSWNRTATLAATYPGLIFNSNGTKWGGISYDYSAAMRFWVNAVNDDIFATTAVVSILNDGNVGIGTTTPTKRLHISTSANEGIFLQGTGGGVWMDIQVTGGNIHSIGAQVGGMGIYNRTSSLYRFFITDAGNVGIGTSAPAHRLDVQGGLANFGQTATNGSAFRWGSLGTAVSPDTMLCMNQLWNGSAWSILNASYGTTYLNLGGTVASPDIQFGTGPANTAATTKMIILNSGNVGVGTLTPSSKLHVVGDGLVTNSTVETTFAITSTWSNAYLNLQRADNSSISYIQFRTGATNNWQVGVPAGGAFFWMLEAGVERFRIAAGGAVTFSSSVSASGLISSATEFRLNNNSYSRVAILDTNGGIAGGYNFKLSAGNVPQHDSLGAISGYYYNSNGSLALYTGSSQAANTNATPSIFIDASRNIGIGGITAPTNKLHIKLSDATHANEGIYFESPSGYGGAGVYHDYNQGNGTTAFKIHNTYSGAMVTLSQESYNAAGSPGSIRFYTSPSAGANTPIERGRITPGGTFVFGDTVIPGETAWKGTAVFGQNGTNKVITGYLASSTNGAIIGGHSSALNAWADLNISGVNLIFRSSETEFMRLTSIGRLGVGVTTPQKKLDVVGTGIVASFGGLIGNGNIAGISFGYSESTSNNDNYKKAALVFERTETHGQGANASGKIHFLLNNTGATSATALTDAVVTIDSGSTGAVGSVRMGIGTRNPTMTLDVVGSIRASEMYGTTYDTLTSGAGTGTAVYDTLTTSGAGAYEVVIRANPNQGGSGSYRDWYIGKLVIGTGYDGVAVVHYIDFIQQTPQPRTLFGSGGGNLVVTAVFNNSGTESESAANGATYTIRFKISGYNTANTGAGTAIYLKKIGI